MFFFPRKEAKALVLLRRSFRSGFVNVFGPKIREADPGGLGACPQKVNQMMLFLHKRVYEEANG
jgi:hypothetical protein